MHICSSVAGACWAWSPYFNLPWADVVEDGSISQADLWNLVALCQGSIWSTTLLHPHAHTCGRCVYSLMTRLQTFSYPDSIQEFHMLNFHGWSSTISEKICGLKILLAKGVMTRHIITKIQESAHHAMWFWTIQLVAFFHVLCWRNLESSSISGNSNSLLFTISAWWVLTLLTALVHGYNSAGLRTRTTTLRAEFIFVCTPLWAR